MGLPPAEEVAGGQHGGAQDMMFNVLCSLSLLRLTIACLIKGNYQEMPAINVLGNVCKIEKAE